MLSLLNSLLSIDTSLKHIELSLRSAKAERQISNVSGLSSFKSGQIIDGSIKKIESYGVFIKINETNISGLCHKSEVR